MSNTTSTPATKASWFENGDTLAVAPGSLKDDDVTYFEVDGTGTASEMEKKHFERFKEGWKPFSRVPHYDLPADTLKSMWAELHRLSVRLSNDHKICYTVYPQIEKTRVAWRDGALTDARSLGVTLEPLPDWNTWDGSKVDDIGYSFIDIPVKWVAVGETKIRHYPEGFSGPDSPAQDRELAEQSLTAELTVDWDKLPVQQRTRLLEEGEKATGFSGIPVIMGKALSRVSGDEVLA